MNAGNCVPSSNPETPERTCLLVLGMHRSGTSALTRVIGLLGAALPRNVLGAGRGNETGHWEPAPLVALHDQMLAEAGSSWDDWRKLDLERQLPSGRLDDYRNEICGMIRSEYADAPVFVLKDPRICRFVPLYRDALACMGITARAVLMVRNPLSVSASLKKRNAMSGEQASLCWLRHVLASEAETRDLPRAVLSYEALVEDWRSAIGPVALRLGLDWPRGLNGAAPEVDTFISRSHDHNPVDPDAVPADCEHSLIKRGYASVRQLLDSDSGAAPAIDAIAAEFEQAMGTPSGSDRGLA